MKAVGDRADRADGPGHAPVRPRPDVDRDTTGTGPAAPAPTPRTLTSRGVLRLQRSAGNAAVAGLVARARTAVRPRPAPSAPQSAGQAVAQRTSAGNGAAASGGATARVESAPATGPVVQRLAGGHPSPPPAPQPVRPGSDPRFKKVVGETKATAAKLRAHPPAKAEAGKASAAAVPPTDDKDAQAKAAKADKMSGAKPGGFDKAAFMAAVRKAIAAKAPKNLEEADEFAESGKADGVKAEVMGKVDQGKEASAKDIATKTAEAPDPSKAKEKPVTPLAPDTAVKPPAPDTSAAMPAKAPPEQTDLGAGKAETDKEMADAEVTEDQLAKSNEPEFTDAVAAKKEGEEHSATAPDKVRASEAATLQDAAAGADQSGKATVAGLVQSRAGATSKVAGGKSEAKTKEEQARAKVTAEITRIFDATKTDVDKILNDLDGKVATKFEQGEKAAKSAFTADHERRMDEYKDERYSGLRGKARWLRDKLAGMPAEANNLFLESKKLYESKMEVVISDVADLIGGELTRAKDRIAKGRDQITKFVASQPKELRKVAGDAAKDIGDKFDQLEQDVDDKQDALVDDLATRYSEARNAVDEEIKELQAANRGLWDKAKDAIGGAIKTILKLKDMLLGVLARAAGAIGKIIKDPIGFLGNLINAVKSGVMGFGERIVDHLKAAMQNFLFGSLASAGIEIPESFDLKGIIKLILSILGLTWTNIRTKIVKRIGETAMGAVEKGVDIFKTLATEGVGGLWKFLVDKLSDLKDTVMDAIQDFVVVKIVKAGITWLISALNPAAAFIKACKMIYDVVMFFVEKGSQIKEFVDSVLDSIESIVGGGVGAVAKHIENTLAKILPLLLGFLASLLGLGGISEKIKEILQKVQKPVEKAVDVVINGALKLARPIINLAKRGAAWVKGKVEKGKAFVKGAVEKGKAKVRGAVDSAKRRLGLGPKDEKQAGEADGEPTGDVHADVARDVQAALADGTDPDAVPGAVDAIFRRHQPHGLKSLETRPKEDAPGEFEVFAQASPIRRVTVFRVSDLQLSFPRTACIVHVTHRGSSENLGKFISGRGAAGESEHHAEQRMIPLLTDRYFTEDRPKGKYDIQLSITRSPCTVCGPKLETFKETLAGRGFRAKFNIRIVSAYGGAGDVDTIGVLQSLRKHGFKLDVLTLEDIVAEDLLSDTKRELSAEDKVRLAEKAADAESALRKATVKKGT